MFPGCTSSIELANRGRRFAFQSPLAVCRVSVSVPAALPYCYHMAILRDLPVELWRRILDSFVREDLGEVAPQDWERKACSPGPALPRCFILSQVCPQWETLVTHCIRAARLAEVTLEWDQSNDEVVFTPGAQNLRDVLTLNIRGAVGAKPPASWTKWLGSVPNVRRIHVSHVPPNAFFDAASKCCPAVTTITGKDWLGQGHSAQGTYVYVDPETGTATPATLGVDAKLLGIALSRWHAAGFGGLHHLHMRWDVRIDDTLLTTMMRTCPHLSFPKDPRDEYFGDTFITAEPQFDVSDALWEKFVWWIGGWREFDWAKVHVSLEHPGTFPRRLLAFAQASKPNLRILRFGASAGRDGARITKESLTAVLKPCPKLSNLTIFPECFDLSEGVFEGFGQTLAEHCPKLKKLVISSCAQSAYDGVSFEDDDFAHISDLPNLADLEVIPWLDMKAKHLVSLLKVPKSIDERSVRIRGDGEQCSPKVLLEFLRCLARLPEDFFDTTDFALDFELGWDYDEDAFEKGQPLAEEISERFGGDDGSFTCLLEEEQLIIRIGSDGDSD
ncbi:uncharacterized protein EV422DRAFT_537022 [Fimicolochytrium jonesii]|uniref:uncharacterized protein n=1 Tax=Fimicolochytrium jonesii TaxID=1396493 RepID=UPI0022FEAF10|nr:uncharacterized protein EV422DRAFT_537022 [Fimicolochytrium jonesii]KAI8818844.1 hypothetical protein EV422DRAFT_537022 [Fimicolochytrium jonesii]